MTMYFSSTVSSDDIKSATVVYNADGTKLFGVDYYMLMTNEPYCRHSVRTVRDEDGVK